EAGMRLSALAEILARKRQRLPVDAPLPAQATIGGLMATNSFGPRRFGHRTIRDYLIGMRAVDGQGQPFAGGGRVVKNAAGYDISRLLIGSLGTLGVVTQVSLMVRPMAETSAMIAAGLPDLDTADSLLVRLFQSALRPVSIDLLTQDWGADGNWASEASSSLRMLVGFEGSRNEVAWMIDTLRRDWAESSARDVKVLDEADTMGMWQWMTELPAQLQANLPPSKTSLFLRRMKEIDPGSVMAAHAGDGVVRIRLSADAAANLATVLASKVRPVIEELEGKLVVLSVAPGSGLGRDDVWGPAPTRPSVMHALKERFDPLGILNPGRWVF
ncbi:MAG: FAD-binding oxidoreductase, partial [Patescibacteria group bacterium]|nr:FAD-binding oxidoreductase [Patescibacteria group bacterium]